MGQWHFNTNGESVSHHEKGPQNQKKSSKLKKIERNDFHITNVEWREQLRPMYAIFNARTQEYSVRVSYTKACFA